MFSSWKTGAFYGVMTGIAILCVLAVWTKSSSRGTIDAKSWRQTGPVEVIDPNIYHPVLKKPTDEVPYVNMCLHFPLYGLKEHSIIDLRYRQSVEFTLGPGCWEFENFRILKEPNEPAR